MIQYAVAGAHIGGLKAKLLKMSDEVFCCVINVLAHRLGSWANISPTLGQRVVFAAYAQRSSPPFWNTYTMIRVNGTFTRALI